MVHSDVAVSPKDSTSHSHGTQIVSDWYWSLRVLLIRVSVTFDWCSRDWFSRHKRCASDCMTFDIFDCYDRATNFSQTPKKNNNDFWNCHLAMLGRVAKPIVTSLCPGQPLRVWVCWGSKSGTAWEPLAIRRPSLSGPQPRDVDATGMQPSAFGGFGTHAPGTPIQSSKRDLHKWTWKNHQHDSIDHFCFCWL